MREAISLAERGTGHVSPNPLVGAVVVKDGHIVGRGWHQRYGAAHAEVNALNDAGERAIGSTVYVTLEPCTHTDKTPPCTNALIDAKVATVVVASRDPNPLAAGGVEILRAAGIQVITGVEEESADFLNRAFLFNIRTNQPWVVAKTATSLDGKIATRTGHSQWITGEMARSRGHDIRQSVDAILIGGETLRADNPSLTVRRCMSNTLAQLEPSHPLRVIVSGSGDLPVDRTALNGSLPGRTLIITTEKMPMSREDALLKNGNEIVRLNRRWCHASR